MALTYYLQHIKRERKYPKIQIFENTPECPFSFFSHFSLFFFFCCIIMDDTNLTTSVYFCFNFFFFFCCCLHPAAEEGDRNHFVQIRHWSRNETGESNRKKKSKPLSIHLEWLRVVVAFVRQRQQQFVWPRAFETVRCFG